MSGVKTQVLTLLLRILMYFQINCLIFGIWFIAIIAAILPMWGIGSYVADVSIFFFFLPPFLANMPIISFLNVFQTYLLACCPDTWSTKLHERMYVYGLIIFAWLLPLTIITICYQKVRKIQKIHHETLYSFTSGTNT